jgi:hypothetical protein
MYKLLERAEMDKKAHFFYGAVLALPATVCPLLGLLIASGVGIWKEVWDKVTGRGNPEALDALYTIGGGVCMSGWIWVLYQVGGLI